MLTFTLGPSPVHVTEYSPAGSCLPFTWTGSKTWRLPLWAAPANALVVSSTAIASVMNFENSGDFMDLTPFRCVPSFGDRLRRPGKRARLAFLAGRPRMSFWGPKKSSANAHNFPFAGIAHAWAAKPWAGEVPGPLWFSFLLKPRNRLCFSHKQIRW